MPNELVLRRFLSQFSPCCRSLSGFFLGVMVTWFAGENPFNVLKILFVSAFALSLRLRDDLVLQRRPWFSPGLRLRFRFRRDCSISARKGSSTVGALAAAAVGVLFRTCRGRWRRFLRRWRLSWREPSGARFPAIFALSAGSHEVINTIMLNFVAAGLTSWVTFICLKNPASQNPETAHVGAGYLIERLAWFDDAPVSWGLLVAPLVAGLDLGDFVENRFRI